MRTPRLLPRRRSVILLKDIAGYSCVHCFRKRAGGTSWHRGSYRRVQLVRAEIMHPWSKKWRPNAPLEPRAMTSRAVGTIKSSARRSSSPGLCSCTSAGKKRTESDKRKPPQPIGFRSHDARSLEFCIADPVRQFLRVWLDLSGFPSNRSRIQSATVLRTSFESATPCCWSS